MNTAEDGFYRAVSWVLTILMAPLWIPLVLYIAVTYHWTDTIPKEEYDE